MWIARDENGSLWLFEKNHIEKAIIGQAAMETANH